MDATSLKVLLKGEQGVGKSHLAAHFGAHVLVLDEYDGSDLPTAPVVVAVTNDLGRSERGFDLVLDVRKPVAQRRYLITGPNGDDVALATWDELAAVNEDDTLAEIAEIAVGDWTILGQSDPVMRLADDGDDALLDGDLADWKALAETPSELAWFFQGVFGFLVDGVAARAS